MKLWKKIRAWWKAFVKKHILDDGPSGPEDLY